MLGLTLARNADQPTSSASNPNSRSQRLANSHAIIISVLRAYSSSSTVRSLQLRKLLAPQQLFRCLVQLADSVRGRPQFHVPLFLRFAKRRSIGNPARLPDPASSALLHSPVSNHVAARASVPGWYVVMRLIDRPLGQTRWQPSPRLYARLPGGTSRSNPTALLNLLTRALGELLGLNALCARFPGRRATRLAGPTALPSIRLALRRAAAFPSPRSPVLPP